MIRSIPLRSSIEAFDVTMLLVVLMFFVATIYCKYTTDGCRADPDAIWVVACFFMSYIIMRVSPYGNK